MDKKIEVKIMEKNNANKPVIETLVNTAAIALTGSGTASIVGGFKLKGLGVVMILLGMGLEFFKYWGRKKKYWG